MHISFPECGMETLPTHTQRTREEAVDQFSLESSMPTKTKIVYNFRHKPPMSTNTEDNIFFEKVLLAHSLNRDTY